MRWILLLALVMLSVGATAFRGQPADDYSADDLCRAIGQTPNVAVTPRDRLFFEKTCVCFGHGLGCAARGSSKAQAMEKADREATKQEEKVAIEKDAAKRAKQKQQLAERDRKIRTLRKLYRTCANDPEQMDCGDAMRGLAEACGIEIYAAGWEDCAGKDR